MIPLDVLQTWIMIGAALFNVALVVLVSTRRFRLKTIRAFMADFAQLRTYSEMGAHSGDVRLKAKVERKMQEAIPGLVSKMVGNNPVVGLALDYFLNETEVGEWAAEDPRIFPLMMGWAMTQMQNAEGFSHLLSQPGLLGGTQQKGGLF